MIRLFVFFSVFICLYQTSSSQALERYKNLTDTVISSKYLGYEKNIKITVPLEFQERSGQTFPLVIIFDSQNSRVYNYILATIDYLTANDQIPSLIVIGVDSRPARRYQETNLPVSDSKALGLKNEEFIFEELVGLARQKYQASVFTTLLGHSRYGYFSSYLLFKNPTKLNAVISVSPFFEQRGVNLTDSIENIIKGSMLDRHLYYRFSAGQDFQDDYFSMQAKLKNLKPHSTKVNVKGHWFDEAHHLVTPGLTIGPNLYEIFAFWHAKQGQYESQNNSILKSTLEKEVTEHYGSRIRMGLGALNGKGWQYYGQKEYRKAIKAWQELLEDYPNFSEGYLSIAKAESMLKKPVNPTINMFKKSLKDSSFYSVKQKEYLLIESESVTDSKKE